MRRSPSPGPHLPPACDPIEYLHAIDNDIAGAPTAQPLGHAGVGADSPSACNFAGEVDYAGSSAANMNMNMNYHHQAAARL